MAARDYGWVFDEADAPAPLDVRETYRRELHVAPSDINRQTALDRWNQSKRDACRVASACLDYEVDTRKEPQLMADLLLGCQPTLPLVNKTYIRGKVWRCGLRICPVDARSHFLRVLRQGYYLADTLHGQDRLYFFTLVPANTTYEELKRPVHALSRWRPFRDSPASVLGYHLSPGGLWHIHGMVQLHMNRLGDRRFVAPEDFGGRLNEQAKQWFRRGRSYLRDFDWQPVNNLAATWAYICQPVDVMKLDDLADAPRLHEELRGRRLVRPAGRFAYLLGLLKEFDADRRKLDGAVKYHNWVEVADAYLTPDEQRARTFTLGL